MIVKKLTAENIDEYRELRLRGLIEDSDSFLRTYEEEVNITKTFYLHRFTNEWAADENFILGGFSNNELIGFVGFRREYQEKVKHKSLLWGMYVVPELRKKGVGKILIEEILRRTNNMKGLEQINLAVITKNEPAKNLYKSYGFQVYGTEKNAVKSNGIYLDEDFMVLILKKH